MSGNGDATREQEAAVGEIARLVAIIEVCAVQAERSFHESQESRRAAERCEHMLEDVKRVVGRLKIGADIGWRHRLMLVAWAALLGAGVSTAMMHFAR